MGLRTVDRDEFVQNDHNLIFLFEFQAFMG